MHKPLSLINRYRFGILNGCQSQSPVILPLIGMNIYYAILENVRNVKVNTNFKVSRKNNKQMFVQWAVEYDK